MRSAICAALIASGVALSGCGGPAEPLWAPEAEVQRRAYTASGPPTITLFTVINNDSNAGRHSGLMISGAERIMFDPAGSFYHPHAPERNDVHHGFDETVLKVYIDYHARETFDVLIQEIEVTPEVAAQAAQAAQSYGAVPKAQCSLAIGRVLRQVPGFESMPVGYSPNALSRRFAELPGVTTRTVTDDDADANHGVLFVAAQTAQDTSANAR